MNELFPNFRKIKKFCQKSSTLLFGWLFRREKHDKVFFFGVLQVDFLLKVGSERLKDSDVLLGAFEIDLLIAYVQ